MPNYPPTMPPSLTLSPRDRSWIEWILPAEKSGYNVYRNLVGSMSVIGEGRRGKGELILGYEGAEADITTPLPPVFAYGAIETSFGTISITLREVNDNQISVEIVSQRSDEIPPEFEEARRWTYSTWSPGATCPQCGSGLREVVMHAAGADQTQYVLAICEKDRRLWVFDGSTGVNRLIPVTNFYNELMLHKNIRDAKIALDSRRLFTELSAFSDEELTYAFVTYNKLKEKIHIAGDVEAEQRDAKGIVTKFRQLFSKR